MRGKAGAENAGIWEGEDDVSGIVVSRGVVADCDWSPAERDSAWFKYGRGPLPSQTRKEIRTRIWFARL